MARAIVNVANGNIGDIRHSMLTLAQFQTANGTGWVLANGGSCVGTAYAALTGNTTVPDMRGRVVAGVDNMGGVNANNLTSGNFPQRNNLGGYGGSDTHTLTSAQSGIPAHAHASPSGTNFVTDTGSGYSLNTAAGGNWALRGSGTSTSNSAASDASQAHNNTQPTVVTNIFIKVN